MAATRTRTSIEVVEDFLAALERMDVEAAADHLTDDAVWHNVGFPKIVGRAAVVDALQGMGRLPGVRFSVEMHNIAADGDVVLTERTDELRVGPAGGAFWVCGTFELRDGRIAVWRDRFDMVDVLRGTVVGTAKGLVGLVTRR